MASVGSLNDLLHPFDAAAEWAGGKPANEPPATTDGGVIVDTNPKRGTSLTPTGKIVLGALGILAVVYLGKKVVDHYIGPAPVKGYP